MASTSIGILPTAWAASVWKNTLDFRQMAPDSNKFKILSN